MVYWLTARRGRTRIWCVFDSLVFMVFQRTYIILLQVDHLQDKMSSVDVFAGMADPAVDPPGEVVKYMFFLGLYKLYRT